MAGRASSSRAQGAGGGGSVLKQLVQTLRGDLNTLSNEARKKYPAVREVRMEAEGMVQLMCVLCGVNCVVTPGGHCLRIQECSM